MFVFAECGVYNRRCQPSDGVNVTDFDEPGGGGSIDPSEKSAGSIAVVLPPNLTAPAQARDHIADLLGERSITQDALLATSELVTNAYRHAVGVGEIALEALVDDLKVLVRVRNRGTIGAPRKRRAKGDRERGGWGLQIVESIVDEWGIDQEDGSVTAWFEIRTDASAQKV